MDDALSNTKSAKRQPLSVWELPEQLLTSVHRFRRRIPRKGKERRHYAAILAFVYRSRFVTASQVQRRFAQFLKSDRTARRHLAEMQKSLGYLDLVPTPSPVWPKVYRISHRGLRKLRHSFAKQGKAAESFTATHERRPVYSIQHVVHELFISEFLLSIWEATTESAELKLLTVQRRSLTKHSAFRIAGNPATRIVPDAMFTLQRQTVGMICTFLEIDTGSMSLSHVLDKLRQYGRWAESENGVGYLLEVYRKFGATTPRPVFRVAMVCGGFAGTVEQHRIEALHQRCQNLPRVVRDALWFTTTSELRSCSANGQVMAAPIWRVGKSADLASRPFL